MSERGSDEPPVPSPTQEFGSGQGKTDALRLDSAISSSELRLQAVYDQLRGKLEGADREALKKEEIQWIKAKDSLPPNSSEKLKSIENRIRVLELQLNDHSKVGSTDVSLDAAIAASETRLQNVYNLLRARLSPSQKEALKKDEIQWIKSKDSLPNSSRERLEAIQNRIRFLETGGPIR